MWATKYEGPSVQFHGKGSSRGRGKRRGGEESQADWITKQGVEE